MNGAWPAKPGVAEQDNRDVLATLAPMRAVLPAGSGALTAADFEAVSTAAIDRDWIESLIWTTRSS